MDKVKQIGIHGFRRLHDMKIDMKPLMVMIGANGAGKTSLLDAVYLLSSSASGNINRTLNDMGGIRDLITRGYTGDVVLSASMRVAGYEPLEYSLCVQPKGQTYAISNEILSQKRHGFAEPFKYIESNFDDIRYFDIESSKMTKPEWDFNFMESSLSQVPKMFKQPEDLRKTLETVTQYHVLDVGKRAPVKLPQQMKPVELPGADGEDLVSFLYYLRESNRNRYDAIEDTLKSAFPGFEYLSFPPVAAGMLTMTWKEKQFNTPLFMHQMSEGTLRFIWLIALLQSPGLSTVTMIDEPEVSLHPELLLILSDLLREASVRTQIIVATHSDRLIRFLEPGEIFVMDIDEDGCTKGQWADAFDIDEWLHDYSLDEIWRLGRMGGRS